MHEATYTMDARLARSVAVDWLLHESVLFSAYGVALVAAALVMVFSADFRLPAAVVFGFTLAYLVGLGRRLAAAARQPQNDFAVRMDDAALEVRSSAVTSICRWSAVSSISLTGRFIFLGLGGRLLAVPRSALSPEALTFLLDAARTTGARVRGA